MATKKKAAGKSAQEFLAAYDKDTIIPQRMRDGLKQLGQTWMTELEFLRLTNVATFDFAKYREAPEFKPYCVEVRGSTTQSARRIWWGDAKLAAEMRKKVA